MLDDLTWLRWGFLGISALAIVCAFWRARREAEMLHRDRQQQAVRRAVRSQLDPSYPPEVWHG